VQRSVAQKGSVLTKCEYQAAQGCCTNVSKGIAVTNTSLAFFAGAGALLSSCYKPPSSKLLSKESELALKFVLLELSGSV
jgi:hypothetical protein